MKKEITFVKITNGKVEAKEIVNEGSEPTQEFSKTIKKNI